MNGGTVGVRVTCKLQDPPPGRIILNVNDLLLHQQVVGVGVDDGGNRPNGGCADLCGLLQP